jgi:methyltransferase family protein
MRDPVNPFLRRHPVLFLLLSLRGVFKRRLFPVLLDYPVTPKPRYGFGKPPHQELFQLFSQRETGIRNCLREFAGLSASMAAIPLRSDLLGEPSWINNWFEGLDVATLYGFVATRRPATYLEIGSGHSTMVARRAIRDHHLATKIISIDPHPRAEVNALCDQVIRTPLEDGDLRVFENIAPGDILFLDSSHCTFMNSDVTVFFMEVLPRLAPGVLVHVHDIELPYDYPPEWSERFYSEQYLLAMCLLHAPERYRVLAPNGFISRNASLLAELDPLWKLPQLAEVSRRGNSFWMEVA